MSSVLSVYKMIELETEIRSLGEALDLDDKLIFKATRVGIKILEELKHVNVQQLSKAIYHVLLTKKNILTHKRIKKLINPNSEWFYLVPIVEGYVQKYNIT